MNLRRILCCCLILCLPCSMASAYIVSFTLPPELDAGTPLVVLGESNLPAGATVETQLYRDVPNFQSVLVATLPTTVRANGSWEVTYDTTGFMSGTYKVQVLRSADYPYGSSSVQLRTLIITGTTPAPTTASPAATAFTPSPSPSPGQTVKEVDLEPTGSPAPVAMIIPALGTGAALLSLRRRWP